MTRCVIKLQNHSKYYVEVVGSRGSDWGNVRHQTVEKDQGIEVTDMGCPRAGTETDHWGWIYFKAYDPEDMETLKYFYFFMNLNDSGHINEFCMDYAAMAQDTETPGEMKGDRFVSNQGDIVNKTEKGRTRNIATLTWVPDKDNLNQEGNSLGYPIVTIDWYY